ncbi:MAG TPA: maleylpyruvate isomerase family mycothiol-dependent enzyme [Actinomycetota bacterium]|nr:maleylpyruvate isomerase family mycothiol-dependent enzyme [Actinomycetota bacterium]
MTTFGEAYQATRRSVVDLVTGISEEEASRRVPACPDWRVRDVLAHLAGIAVDATKGDLEGVGSPEWTRRQVDERADRTIVEIVAEWDEAGRQIDGSLEYFPKAAASLFVGDTVTHEHDIRLPLGQPGDRSAPAVELALDGYVRWFGRRLKERELPAVRLLADGKEWVAGAGEPGAVAEAPSAFDLLRALTGRRTRDEIAAFRWTGERERFVDVFSMYGMPAAPLGE